MIHHWSKFYEDCVEKFFLKTTFISMIIIFFFNFSVVNCNEASEKTTGTDSKIWIGVAFVSVLTILGGYWKYSSAKNITKLPSEPTSCSESPEIDLAFNSFQPWQKISLTFNWDNWISFIGLHSYNFVVNPTVTLVKFLAMHKVGIVAICFCISTVVAPQLVQSLKPEIQGFLNKISKALMYNYIGWNVLELFFLRKMILTKIIQQIYRSRLQQQQYPNQFQRLQ